MVKQQNTCYVHRQTSDSNEEAFIMRAERFIPEWNRRLREVVGEDNVHQLKILGGKTAWAVPWDCMADATAVAKEYFTTVTPERESILGFAPFDDNQLKAIATILEHGPSNAPIDASKFWVNPLITGEFHTTPMTIQEVGSKHQEVPEDDAFVYLSGAAGELTLGISKDEAKAFGKRLYSTVIVSLREPKDGEVDTDNS